MEFSPSSNLKDIRVSITQSLAGFVREENRYLRSIGPELDPVADSLERFLLDSGKRLRPLFAYVGFLGTGATPNKSILAASSALELIHVCALIHDDVMDASDTRRGAPAIHKAFEAMHVKLGLQGSAAQFGISSAILLGDLALIWASKMLHQSGLESETMIRALPVYDEMRVELMAGQYLDVYEQGLATQSVERSLRVARYKSGKYSVERPLHFGAALGRAYPEILQAQYSQYGLPLGEAFQMRDDVLGVFGDTTETGKPVGDDLREGKRTVLIATTMELGNEIQKHKFTELFGDPQLSPEGVLTLQEIIVDTGALARLEELIEVRTTAALHAIRHDSIAAVAQGHLENLITIAIRRTL